VRTRFEKAKFDSERSGEDGSVDNASDALGAETARRRDFSIADEAESTGAVEVEEGPVHRPLIRAQLPRIEGQKEERRLPEFTIRQAPRGPGHFRGADPRMKQQRPGGPGNGNGNRPHGGTRFAGSRPPGPGRGQGGRGGPAAGGFRAGQPPRHGGGGKKRSR